MKHSLFLVLVVLLLVATAGAQYRSNPLLIVNSPHDLSSGNTTVGAIKSSDFDQICAFCHVAHQTTTQAGQDPLWNHTITATNFTTFYQSDTFDNSANALGQATVGTATTSHLCLSCHDGSVAVNSVYKSLGTITMAASTRLTSNMLNSTSTAYVGTSLSDDHPTNMTYATYASDTNYFIKNSMTTLPLFSGKVQCATCHMPHNNVYNNFLRISNAASALCTTCHGE